MKRRAFPQNTQRQGMSLVEVIIVLGISSLLIGGAISWLNSRSGTNFYDQMRQVESVIREAEASSQTNLIPGTEVPGCAEASRPGCPIQTGEEAFASAVGIQKNQVATASDVIRTFYIKKKAVDTGTNLVEKVEPYASTDYKLPIDVRYAGYQYISPSTPCALSPDSLYSIPPVTTPVGGPNDWSLMVFRKQPNAMYGFYYDGTKGSSSVLYDAPFGINPFVTSNGFAKDNNLPGNYRNYGYDSPGNTLPAVPCAVVWQFESAEKLSGSSKPRYTAEIIFNVTNGTIRLQTR